MKEKEKRDLIRRADAMRDSAEMWLDNEYNKSIKSSLQRGKRLIANFKYDMLAIEEMYRKSEKLRNYFGEYIDAGLITMLVHMRRGVSYEDFYADLNIKNVVDEIVKISCTIKMVLEAVYGSSNAKGV